MSKRRNWRKNATRQRNQESKKGRVARRDRDPEVVDVEAEIVKARKKGYI